MTANKKIVGVIGGMGPDATIDFMAKVISLTSADSDQEHIRMLVEHNPHIPSRQEAMAGTGEDPGAVIASMATRLEASGADFIVMPCNAAHGWQDKVVAAAGIPFVSIIDESVSAAVRLAPGGGAIGILTTPACFSAGLYQRALADKQRAAVMQSPDELATTMSLIDRIKAGDKSEDIVEGLRELAEQLVTRGATVIIAACTELPLVLEQSMFNVPLVSSTDALAEKTVELALGDSPSPER
ncbi:MAG: amino acid racemase [Woeseiaceae bacterium]|nr:amino acid racemase [Woeseiaceae bacterium]